MCGTTTSTDGRVGRWRELFDHDHRAPVVVLAGGIGLFATNTYVTVSLLPSAVREIGGERLYAWTMTIFVVAAVVSSMLVSRALGQWGGRAAYLAGFGVFAAGTAVAAAAPSMPVMLVGRGIQGLAAGLLAGLGFAVLRLVLPERLWQRAIALMSAMYGVLGVCVVGCFLLSIPSMRITTPGEGVSAKRAGVVTAVTDVVGEAGVEKQADQPAAAPAPAPGEKVTRIVAVTACPTGIAHTYMAADALTLNAQGREDVELVVETQGSSSTKAVDPDIIAAADAVIFATDVGVKDRGRFAGKPVVEVLRPGASIVIEDPPLTVVPLTAIGSLPSGLYMTMDRFSLPSRSSKLADSNDERFSVVSSSMVAL